MNHPIDIELYAGSLAPTVTATADATGVLITITDADGVHTAHVNNGTTGATGPQGPTGPQGATGAAFAVTYVASSYEDLIAHPETCQVGQFAVISSTVEDPHNAELYVRVAEAGEHGYWSYITDMSGARGIQGPTGPTGAQGPMSPYVNAISFDQTTQTMTFVFNEPLPDGRTQISLAVNVLPTVSTLDNGKVLRVINGVWSKS